jgi:peptidyl-prolyl cis-trans isomerase D
MLQAIRDKSQGVIAFVILGFVCLTFAFWGVHNYFDGSPAKAPVVKVNGTKITELELDQAFQRYRQNQMQKNPELFATQAGTAKARKALLDSMVTSQLLTQSANKAGFGIGEGLLMMELAHMPAFQVNGVFSKLAFQRFLSNGMFTQDTFFANLSNSMVLAQVRTGFVGTSFALPHEVAKTAMLLTQTRSFHYVMFPARAFSAKVTVPDSAAQAYYQKNEALFMLPKKVSLNYVVLSLDHLMKEQKPDAATLMSYYQSNINHFTTPKTWSLAHILIAVPQDADQGDLQKAKAKAQHVEQQLKSGTTFAALAQSDSDDSATSSNGGLLPAMNLMEVGRGWQQAMLALKQPGAISAPFRTDSGFEVVKLIKTTPAIVKPYATVRADVKKDYVQETAEKRFADLSDKLSTDTFEHPNTLSVAAKTLGVSVQETPLFSQDKGVSSFTRNQKVQTAAFSTDVLGGNNSDVVQLNDTEVVVVRVKQKVPETIKAFSAVKLQILKTLQEKAELSKAKTQADHMLALVNQGQSLQSLAKKAGLHVLTDTNIKRNASSGTNSAVIEQAFTLSRPEKGKANYAVTSVDHIGYAIVALTGVNLGDAPDSKTQNALTQGVQDSHGMLDYALYVKGLRDQAHIKYYKDKH